MRRPPGKQIELVQLAPGQVIYREGEQADAFYIIRIGHVKVSQATGGVLTYLRPAVEFDTAARGTQRGRLSRAILARSAAWPIGRRRPMSFRRSIATRGARPLARRSTMSSWCGSTAIASAACLDAIPALKRKC